MKVEEIMSRPVVFTQKTIKVSHLKDTFNRKSINAVPVMEVDGTICGIVSSRDLVTCHDESLLVENIMSSKVHIAVLNNRVKDAAKIMVKHNVHHLVVMDDGMVVGMLSSMDIMKVFTQE